MNQTIHEGPGPQSNDPVESAAEPDPLTPEQLAALWEEEAPPPAGGLSNLISSLFATALGGAGMALAAGLGLGTPAAPGPGLWPFVMSLAIVVFGAVQIVVGRHGGDGEKFSKLSWLTAAGFATLIGLVLLMPVIGFEIPSLLLCLVWMKLLGGETWRAAVLYSLLVVAGFYAIFILALGTTIPHLF
ncbi:tripartite tricarboxylate transporter TctB family protein [Zafaria sp. Z1313]|uniref:tripartite tricarboxylate transporter TctB family protein n=1 Tax=Zafaria sp. Z1313 TaxID=3423202 RepID=UPI003D303D27